MENQKCLSIVKAQICSLNHCLAFNSNPDPISSLPQWNIQSINRLPLDHEDKQRIVVNRALSSVDGPTEVAPSAKDLLDYKLELLLRQWNKSTDLLFAIHPLDGSLMTWTLEWLDDAWKQPVVSFASRLPDAFPLADVGSMSVWLHTLHPASQHGFTMLALAQHSQKWLNGGGDEGEGHAHEQQQQQSNNNNNPFGSSTVGLAERDDVCLLTRHHHDDNDHASSNNNNGTTSQSSSSSSSSCLNLWRLQTDDDDDAQSDYHRRTCGGRRTTTGSTMTTTSAVAVPQLHHQQQSIPFSIASVLQEFRLTGEEQRQDGNTLLEVLNSESLFDAFALVTPLLPQYHPVQLVGLLNSGRIQRVKAILLNILRSLCHRQQGTSPMFKLGKHKATAAAIRQQKRHKMNVEPRSWDTAGDDAEQQRRNSASARCFGDATTDAGGFDYDEMAAVNPLPLYALLASDNAPEKAAAAAAAARTRSGDGQSPKVVPTTTTGETTVQQNASGGGGVYDALFTPQYGEDELDLDSADVESFSLTSRKPSLSRTRKISEGSFEIRAFASSDPNTPPPTNLAAKHSRLLTEMLTHIRLPGLTSVDQMHLLAVADTISHFSTNAIVDRLAQANAELQPIIDRSSSLGDSAAAGYAISGSGIDTVDECGLRFLMAKKRHEYLLRCLPIKQRRVLKAKGISTAYIIWAFHSNTEVELLNAIPCCQRQEESWEELRSYGIAWWLRNTAMLRNCMERVAKNAFQRKQEPMDAALFYMAMRKKNVLTQLFKTVNDSRMYEFFREDFTLEKWKKGALKNAFVLMSKQRFQHAAAFFLLGGSLKDAIQTILNRIGDLQLAIVVLRFYESDPERQLELMTELLCREVLGCEPAQFHALTKEGRKKGNKVHFPSASRDPFERSMALWLMNEYALSAATLIEEPSTVARSDGAVEERRGSLVKDLTSGGAEAEVTLPDIFNFYAFLRRHPLVIRQKLANAGISTTSTEQFLTWTHRIGAKLSAEERQLYLRTASAHLAAGCPLLALDVLSRTPAQMEVKEEEGEGDNNGDNATTTTTSKSRTGPISTVSAGGGEAAATREEVDWSVPISKLGPVDDGDKLELKWSDEEEESDGKETAVGNTDTDAAASISQPKNLMTAQQTNAAATSDEKPSFHRAGPGSVDVAAQNLKLLATLSIITDELNTLVVGGGYEVAGGQLRLELFSWLERECTILHNICDIQQGDAPVGIDAVDTLFVRPLADDECGSSSSSSSWGGSQSAPSALVSVKRQQQQHQQQQDNSTTTTTGGDAAGAVSAIMVDDGGVPLLHEAIRQDRDELRERVRLTLRRRNWLQRHRRLLFTLAAYCALHSAQNSRLIAVQMELLLLLLEVQRQQQQHQNDADDRTSPMLDTPAHTDSLPGIHSFPLLVSSISSSSATTTTKNTAASVTSPLRFMMDQYATLMHTFSELNRPPDIGSDRAKLQNLFPHCQVLSLCVYQSLSDVEELAKNSLPNNYSGPLTLPLVRRHSNAGAKATIVDAVDSLPPVTSLPSHWPGVNNLIALLSRERIRSADKTPPNLRLLLVEFFVAIVMGLFCHAFALYDARWLFRLCAHSMDVSMFSHLFGGGGERRLRSAVPARPPPPMRVSSSSGMNSQQEQRQQQQQQQQQTPIPKSIDQPQQQQQDEAAIRAKLHAKVFRMEAPSSSAKGNLLGRQQHSEQVVQCWVPPKKHIVQYFADKVVTPVAADNSEAATMMMMTQQQQRGLTVDWGYNSDDETPPPVDNNESSELCSGDDDQQHKQLLLLHDDDHYGNKQQRGDAVGQTEEGAPLLAHEALHGYAWTLLRLAIVRHVQHRLRNFVEMVGFDLQGKRKKSERHLDRLVAEIAHISPKLNLTLKRLASWACQLEDEMEAWKDGCPVDFLPNIPPIPDGTDPSAHSSSASSFVSSWSSPLLHKYRFLLEPGNSPFEYGAPGVRAVRRLWNFLVAQENLAPIFVRYSFAKTKERIAASVFSASDGASSILSVIKLVHREHDPIVAFAVNSLRPGLMAVSTGRELQELCIDRVLDEHERVVSRLPHFPSTSSFLMAQNWAELDISMQQVRRDPLRDNDDYQLLIPGSDSQQQKHIPTQTSAHNLNPFIVDRSRLCLQKLRKRLISGIRRLEAHSSLPYYVSGSSDGSIFLWEWGVEQPVFVARCAGQFAKVAKLAFAQNGARFAAIDGDGLLSIWQAQPGVPAKKPHFVQKCHNKFASDVKFLGQTSTLLVTAGHSINDQNIALWDILMPQSKCMVHSFVGHPDGAYCVAYQASTQSLISGGKHGELCIWDVRQRQLRATLRAFDNANASVRCICLDPSGDIIAAGSSEGDIKVWSSGTVVPHLMYSLPTEHAARSGFSLRQVASVSLQGVQQINIDSRMNMCSCGADNSLKLRIIPNFSTSATL